MTDRLSIRSQQIKPSPTLALSARASQLKAEGKSIVDLTAGEPDFDTPLFVKNEAIKAIERGFTKYTAVDGIPPLKQAIIQKFKIENQLDYGMKQILVSCGAKQSLFNLTQAVINPGDEVIIPAPYWVSYPDMVLLAEGCPVILSTEMDNQLKITPEQLDAAITVKTKLVFINSPSNPAGTAYTLDELKALGGVLLKYPHVLIATDDIYEHVLWNKPFVNILNACPDLYDRTIVVNGPSKAYAMTGWRIGYAGGSESIIAAMSKIQSQSTSNPNSIAQVATQYALTGDQSCVEQMCQQYKVRSHFVTEGLNQIDGIQCLYADGTFYNFPNVEGVIKRMKMQDDMELSEYLLQSVGVAGVPGAAFGLPGYIRFSCATDMKTLEEGLNRLRQVLA